MRNDGFGYVRECVVAMTRRGWWVLEYWRGEESGSSVPRLKG